jgi:hypothetical protein
MGASQWADSQPREPQWPRPMRAEPYEPTASLLPAEAARLAVEIRAGVAAANAAYRARLIDLGRIKPASPERLAALQETYREQQRERSAARSGT